MPPHHRPHLPHHHHGPEWLVAVHDDVARDEWASHLRAIADVLAAGSDIEINGTTIQVPDMVEFDLRYERTPHGSLALVIRAEWDERNERASSVTPTRGLNIGPSSKSAAA